MTFVVLFSEIESVNFFFRIFWDFLFPEIQQKWLLTISLYYFQIRIL